METTHRPAARVICLDAAHRLLLLHWRDPFDGTWLWEPPGGGIEPGETPLVAARSELLGTPTRVARAEYGSPLILDLANSGFLAYGVVKIAELVRDWSNKRSR